MCAQADRILFFRGRCGKNDNVGSEGPCEFYAHMSETAESDDPDFLARADLPMTERGIGRDAGAEQGRDSGEIEIFGNAQCEVFIDHDIFGISAKGGAADKRFGSAVGENHARGELLVAGFAMRAIQIGSDHAADSGEITDFELRDFVADFFDSADNFMSWHRRIFGVVPFVSGEVDIGMADAAVKDLDLNIEIGHLAPRNRVGR